MRLRDDNELPWAKDYFKETEDDERFHPFLKGKITDSQGILLETDVCKVYFFPAKKITLFLLKYLDEDHKATRPLFGLERSPHYPFYTVHNEGNRTGTMHTNVMGNVTIDLTPTPNTREDKSKKNTKESD